MTSVEKEDHGRGHLSYLGAALRRCCSTEHLTNGTADHVDGRKKMEVLVLMR